MSKIKGGHAIMLKVSVPVDVSACALAWIAADERRQSMLMNAHMTLLFVGRDLDHTTSDHIIRAGKWAATQVPDRLMGKGPLAMFGGAKNHLVALIERTEQLGRIRQKMVDGLRHYDVPISDDFDFNPHVTLAKGTPRDTLPKERPSGRVFPVLGVQIKLGSSRIEEVPLGGVS